MVNKQEISSLNLSDCVSLIYPKVDISDKKILNSLKKINTFILSGLIEGNKLEIRQFGVLQLKSIRPRKFINPKTKAISFLGETYTIYFKQSRSFFN